MEVKYQSSWSCTVHRNDTKLEIASVLISTSYEACVQIKVKIPELEIIDTHWDVYRSPDCFTVRNGDIPVLMGTNIREYSARHVINTLDSDLSEILIELISECIRGVRQSEFFIAEEEFPSYEVFNEVWMQKLLNSCYCYSNLNRAGMLWTDHMSLQGSTRNKSLFHRQKNYNIFENQDGSLSTTACFADTYHEIFLNMSVSKCGQIKDVSGKFLRSPNAVCYDIVKILKNLRGKNLFNMNKKEIAKFVGGSLGCTHLLEMCYDLGLSLSSLQAQEDKVKLQA